MNAPRFDRRSYRRGARDALQLLGAAVGILLYFAFYFWVGGGASS